jgi:hypothetical protein
MSAIGKFSTVALVMICVFAAANWKTIRTAWRYRKELDTAAGLAGDLEDMGVLK